MQKTDSENLACGANEQIPVSELEGALLDYWVAKAEGKAALIERHTIVNPDPVRNMWCWLAIDGRPDFSSGQFNPSANWTLGGPILERNQIELQHFTDGSWGANKWPSDPFEGNEIWPGPTPLIAVMRCYVASKFGESVPTE